MVLFFMSKLTGRDSECLPVTAQHLKPCVAQFLSPQDAE